MPSAIQQEKKQITPVTKPIYCFMAAKHIWNSNRSWPYSPPGKWYVPVSIQLLINRSMTSSSASKSANVNFITYKLHPV